MEMNIVMKYSAPALNSEQALWVEGKNTGGKQLKNGNSSPLLYHQPQSASAPYSPPQGACSQATLVLILLSTST